MVDPSVGQALKASSLRYIATEYCCKPTRTKDLRTYTMKNWCILYIFHTRRHWQAHLVRLTLWPCVASLKVCFTCYLAQFKASKLLELHRCSLPVKMRTLNKMFKSRISTNCAPCYLHCPSLLDLNIGFHLGKDVLFQGHPYDEKYCERS